MTDLLSLKYLPISQANLFTQNAKLHNLDQIIQSIARYGFKSACKWEGTLNDGRGGIVAGNGRVEALREMERRGDDLPIGIAQDETGEWCVPVLFGVEAESEAIARAYALDDNNLTLLGGEFGVVDLMKLYDPELLMSELEELARSGEIPVSIGEANLEELLNQLGQSGDDEPEPEYGEDDPTVPEGIQVREGVELGSIWALGRHRIMCADSTIEANVRELLGDREKFEMIFTDPPYGVGYSGGIQFQKDGTVERDNREKLANDGNAEIYTQSIPVMAKFCDGPIYTWFASTKALELYQAIFEAKGEIHAMLVWHKINATYGAMNAQYKQRHEPCLYWKPKGSTLRWVGESTESTLWEIKKDGVNNYHPTQKPTELAEKAMKNHSAKLIGDFFLGSGSTIIAAQQLGDDRTVYGMELSPEYVEVILQRFSTFTGIPAKRIN